MILSGREPDGRKHVPHRPVQVPLDAPNRAELFRCPREHEPNEPEAAPLLFVLIKTDALGRAGLPRPRKRAAVSVPTAAELGD
jgi:hypothetical protein